ncbi:N-acetylmuramoyl-L-alanine amidase [Bacillus sp. MMSF_3328]|uniref:N-acetylmuramoyl-L-alanine amidase n=1 Tax=Bacillus sp. MMSF_3328 TaxID=3047080 RepID=UPI00273F7732|nr:N-acetylmuramoyl-L-alanine amidase [Bacillus sp. MMSF_3328]
MVKIAVSGGHGPETPGKRSPDGFREAQFNHPTANLVIRYLNEYENVQTLKVFDESRDVPLAERTNKANSWGANLYVSVHYNALGSTWSDAHGIETLVYSTSTSSSNGFNVAQKVHAHLIAATKRTNRGIKARPELWEMRSTKMPSFLCECGFMSNKEEKTLMASSSYQQLCARAIVEGIAEFYSLKKKVVEKPVSAPAPKTGETLYRVQVGAFGNLANAQKFLVTVKAAGFSGIIKSSDGLHRIQVGAFSSKVNAEKLVSQLKAKGFTGAWITN